MHIAFPFDIPNVVIRYDVASGIVRPERDQLPGACKNFFTLQSWVDLSDEASGATLASVDAPLIEIGAITAELPWLTKVTPGTAIYSYVMNNYWHTNYKADQEGISTYHYSIRPHGLFNQAEVAREGIAKSHPFIICPARKDVAGILPPFAVAPGNVIATSLKPIEGGRGYIVRLFYAGGSREVATFTIGGKPKSVYLSDPWEERGKLVEAIALPANGITTVRVE